ncbi:MAG: SufD family Fe-S cluster assembly protein [Pseudomonadota bacterium]|nr:SufD family Fe-S cluster assembly protein [Pseudomonadota bacterium]
MAIVQEEQVCVNSAYQLSVIDGCLQLHCKDALPETMIVCDLARAKRDYPKLVPATAAQHGLFIYLPDHLQLEEAVWMKFTASSPVQIHCVIVLGKHAKLQCVQDWTASTTQAVFDIQLAEHAELQQVKLQDVDASAQNIAEYTVTQSAHSHFTNQIFSLGGAESRETWQIIMQGEYARCALQGLVIANSTQRMDQQLIIEHAAPHCSSDQQFKAIAADKAIANFSGKVIVRKTGTSAVAHQHSQNLLLSTQAAIGTRPELEVYTDEVKASHGATVGQLDADSLFFLRARGIPLALAQQMLLSAFVATQIDNLAPDVRERVAPAVTAKLLAVKQL